MKIRVEINEHIDEGEIVIRCRENTEQIERIIKSANEIIASEQTVAFYKGSETFYFGLSEVLFFETEGENIYAHTAADAFLVRYRLYELEQKLPRWFIRVSKSAIINVRQVLSVNRNLTASSAVRFHGSYKQVYVSRFYFKAFKQRLTERG